MKYHNLVYDGEYAIYDDVKLTVEYNNRLFRLVSPIVEYYGTYIMSRGICFMFICNNLSLYIYNLDIGRYAKYTLSDFPDRILYGYYQCILTTGKMSICYESENIVSNIMILPDEPYTMSSNHIMYYKDGILTSIPLRYTKLYMPINIPCPFNIKRLYSYNLGCIIRTMDDEYYTSPFDGSIYHIHILDKSYAIINEYVRLDVLDGMNIVDMGYRSGIYIYDGEFTYYNNSIKTKGHYSIMLYSNTLRVQPLRYNRKSKSSGKIYRDIGKSYSDIIILTLS